MDTALRARENGFNWICHYWYNTNRWEWGFDIVRVDKPNDSLCLEMYYDTYEDASEAALDTALEMV